MINHEKLYSGAQNIHINYSQLQAWKSLFCLWLTSKLSDESLKITAFDSTNAASSGI
jgi:hypothetical protein